MNSSNDGIHLSVPVNQRDHIQGLQTAPVILVEYGDYQCPYCAQAFDVVRQLQQQFGDRLGFVFRHFPQVDLHPLALKAAEAAEAASAQGKFWQAHQCLFRLQAALSDADLFECAIELELDINRFLRDVTGNAHAAHIQADINSGVESGVQQTPTFFINGLHHSESWDFDTLLTAITAQFSDIV